MKLDDFITRRRAEIADEIRDLQMELAKLDAADKAAARVSMGFDAPLPENVGHTRRSGVRPGSIKEAILAALSRAPGGLETEELRITMELLGTRAVSRSSLTPQLSRLKQAGYVTQVGRHWMLRANAPREPNVTRPPLAVDGDALAIIPNAYDEEDDDGFNAMN